jgi:hypothetical protein
MAAVQIVGSTNGMKAGECEKCSKGRGINGTVYCWVCYRLQQVVIVGRLLCNACSLCGRKVKLQIGNISVMSTLQAMFVGCIVHWK